MMLGDTDDGLDQLVDFEVAFRAEGQPVASQKAQQRQRQQLVTSMCRVLSSRKAVLIVGGCKQSCQRGSSITMQG